jgi:sodium/proline symporter
MAVMVGVIGKAYMSTILTTEQLGALDGEKIFIYLAKSILVGPFAAILAGGLLTAILAAIMSTADSQLLVDLLRHLRGDICRTHFQIQRQ